VEELVDTSHMRKLVFWLDIRKLKEPKKKIRTSFGECVVVSFQYELDCKIKEFSAPSIVLVVITLWRIFHMLFYLVLLPCRFGDWLVFGSLFLKSLLEMLQRHILVN
jgi:hypothetical protein